MFVGRPATVAEVDDMMDRVEAVRREARLYQNRALVIDCEDRLCELSALRQAMIPEQRRP